LRNDLVRHVPAATHEVPTGPQVPTPELRPQLSAILQQVMRGLPLNRLHHAARRQVRRGAQQQMDMGGLPVALPNLYVLASTNLPDQVADFGPNFAPQHRLAILRDEHEVVVQAVNRMGGSTVVAHGRPSYRKPPEGVA